MFLTRLPHATSLSFPSPSKQNLSPSITLTFISPEATSPLPLSSRVRLLLNTSRTSSTSPAAPPRPPLHLPSPPSTHPSTTPTPKPKAISSSAELKPHTSELQPPPQSPSSRPPFRFPANKATPPSLRSKELQSTLQSAFSSDPSCHSRPFPHLQKSFPCAGSTSDPPRHFAGSSPDPHSRATIFPGLPGYQVPSSSSLSLVLHRHNQI